ncbi:MAG: hypothetical protein II901_04820 [Paludibacteraceae bacterium]|nr:hypothetical protein [Paludibacteraceae bacterium]
MRKIFTLAAAVLASFSLWASDEKIYTFDDGAELATDWTVVTDVPSGGTAKCEITQSIGGSWSPKDNNYLGLAYLNKSGITITITSNEEFSNIESISIDAVANDNSKPTIAAYIETEAGDVEVFAPIGTKDGFGTGGTNKWGNKTVTLASPVSGKLKIVTVASSSGKYAALDNIKIVYSAGAPSTDPVATVTLDGPTEGFVGKEVSFSVTTDVKANAYKWYVDGAEQEGATAAKFNFTPEAERTYRILAAAKNDYNSDFVQSEGLDFVATVKPAAVPCAELYPAAAGDTPAKDAKAALTDASYGGNIIFAGAKDGKYAESFQYNDLGLQMCKGGADSVRVELGFNLAVGSKIELHITVGTMCDTKERGFNLLAPGQKKVMGAVWKPKETAEATDSIVSKVFEYEVTASDGMAGQNKFGLQRSNSAILQAIIVSDCGEEIVPDTDPVTSVTVAGPAEGFVGQTYSFTATADADADDWIWFVNDVAVDGAKAATFAFTPDAVGTYAIKAGARNQYNTEDGWINSNEIALVVSEALEQVSVSANTEWDWTKAASVNEIKFTDATSPLKNERCLLANVAGMNNDENFNSQALLFEGEYAIRDGKYCQGQLLQFNTTVAGYVSVEYSNTGNRAEGEDLERILTVNGVKVGEGALRSDATVKEFNIPVEAGDVALSSVLKSDESKQYIRIYKVEFSTEEKVIPEGIENIDASVKAVKIMHDGQLLIKKGDVFYNAQGARLF